MARDIVWLHLSDAHFCRPKTGWDAAEIHAQLIADLGQMEQQHGLRPDLIFFTGDLAYGELSDAPISQQFDEGMRFLESVATAFNEPVPMSNVFLVPGNHDVNRHRVIRPLAEWLDTRRTNHINHTDGIDEMISRDKDSTWQQYLARLDDYREFLERHWLTHLLTDPERLSYAATREVQGVRVGIAGFNSAWSSCRDDERGKLWLGARYQLRTLTQALRGQGANMLIGLVHHPSTWFVPAEERFLRDEVHHRFQFWLHGHEHTAWVTSSLDGCTQIAGGACYDGADQRYGYNFVRLDLVRGRGEVWLRDYQHNNWFPLRNNKTDAHGRWSLGKLTWLAKLGSRAPVTAPVGAAKPAVGYDAVPKQWRDDFAIALNAVNSLRPTLDCIFDRGEFMVKREKGPDGKPRAIIVLGGPGQVVASVTLNIDEKLRAELERQMAVRPNPARRIISSLDEARPEAGGDKYAWVIDPLDGARHVLARFPFFSTTVSLVDLQAKPSMAVLGVTYLYFTGELFFAIKGKGVYLNNWGNRINNEWKVYPAGTAPEEKQTSIYTEFPNKREGRLDEGCDTLKEIFNVAYRARGLSLGSFGLAYTAKGVFDAFIDLSYTSRIHNMAAGCLFIGEAGGQIDIFLDGVRDDVYRCQAGSPDVIKQLRNITVPTGEKPVFDDGTVRYYDESSWC